MANKFPLIADGTAIKELPSGDNLDLTGSGISISGGQGTSGQVLQSNGSTVAWADAAGGGGRWTQIATSTVSSGEVFSVEFSSLGSYDEYELRYQGVLSGSNPGDLNIHFDYGSGYPSTGFRYKARMFSNTSGTYNYTSNSNSGYLGVNISWNTLISSSGTARAPAFGHVAWTNSGSLFKSYYYGNQGNDANQLQSMETIGAHNSYEQTAPTKVKLMSLNSGSETTNSGFSAGTFTLYGLSIS